MFRWSAHLPFLVMPGASYTAHTLTL